MPEQLATTTIPGATLQTVYGPTLVNGEAPGAVLGRTYSVRLADPLDTPTLTDLSGQALTPDVQADVSGAPSSIPNQPSSSLVGNTAHSKINPEKQLVKNQNARLVDAREEYARLSAARGRRHLSRKYSKAAVAAARENYERQRDLSIELEKDFALSLGVTKENLDFFETEFAIGDAERTVKAVYSQRLLATGSYQEINEKGVHDPKEPKNLLGRLTESFDLWWGSHADAKLFSLSTVKKSGALAAAGTAAAIPAAIAGSVLLGPLLGGVAGTAIAVKIAKGFVAHQVHKRGDETIDNVRKMDDELNEAIYSIDENGNITFRRDDEGNLVADNIGNEIDAQANKQVRKNGLRLAQSIGVVAIGSAAGEFALNPLFNSLIGSPKISLDHPLGFGIGEHHSGGASHHAGGGHTGVTTHAAAHHPARTVPHSGHSGGAAAHHQPTGQHWGPGSETVRLGGGNDSVWAEVAKHMDKVGYDGNNNPAVQRVTQAVLSHSGRSWDQARFLPDGFRFRMPPPEVLAELVKKT